MGTIRKHFEGQAGVCPKCGSSKLEYGDMDADGDSLAYAFDCLDCGTHGHEVYNLTFAFHEVIGENDDKN